MLVGAEPRAGRRWTDATTATQEGPTSTAASPAGRDIQYHLGSMPTYLVLINLGFDQRPSRDEQAFLGTLNARVQPWGTTDLQVSLDVAAPDIGAALVSAKELVADPLGAEPQTARVALKGVRVQRSSLWRRWGRRAS